MTRTSRNAPCPCGSGRKFKRCCGAAGAAQDPRALPHTPRDRAAALEALEFFIAELWEEEAFDFFWGCYLDREEELPEELREASNEVLDVWFAFDYEVDEGGLVVDELLAQAPLERGQRSFLEAMRASSMRLYEVLETTAGTSIRLRDLVEGDEVTVTERAASRVLARHECIAARVLPRGCSGQPEIERGVLRIPSLVAPQLVEAVKKRRAEFFAERPRASLADFYKTLAPLYHEAWLLCIFEPPLPQLANTDGEVLTWTRITYDVVDPERLVRALDAAEGRGVRPDGEGAWTWLGKNAKGDEVSLGSLRLGEGRLVVEVNSVARGQRASALLADVAGAFLAHRATTHEDVQRKVKESLSAKRLHSPAEAGAVSPGQAIDPDVADAVVSQHLSRHYRAWLDEPVPALEGQTPRAAAQSPGLRARVEELLGDLERHYEQALKAGQPAYDPSWMWAELGLSEDVDRADSPPPLAHERVAERVPGCAEASRAAAERFRARPAFDDASTTLEEADLERDLDLQRFVRAQRSADNDAGSEGHLAGRYLPLMVNFDLHRRKCFWVDAALSYMLESTDLNVAGRELRTPFPSFAIAFTDRHALHFGERLLSRRPGDALRGQLLRVATVYVTTPAGGASVLDITFAFDALGADLPSLVHYQVPASDEASLSAFLEGLGPKPQLAAGELGDPNAARALLRLVLNAVLYATSAGVEGEVRTISPTRRRGAEPTAPSDSIYFLPGKIDIRRVRQLQELSRAPGGGQQLSRFMVRGHWRRPAKAWADQRLRWIEPYWKGPDLGAVIEKAYRLKA